jgi:hypothetical protein
MAIIYSYPGAPVTLADYVLGTQFDEFGNPTKSFAVKDIVNLVANTTVSNSTATPLSLATLNTTYPSALIGFKVQCANPAVLKIYEKTGTTAWVSYTIALVS